MKELLSDIHMMYCHIENLTINTCLVQSLLLFFHLSCKKETVCKL